MVTEGLHHCEGGFGGNDAAAHREDGLFRGGALVVDRISCCFEVFSNCFFDGESGVIGTNDDARFGGGFAHEQERGILSEADANRNVPFER